MPDEAYAPRRSPSHLGRCGTLLESDSLQQTPEWAQDELYMREKRNQVREAAVLLRREVKEVRSKIRRSEEKLFMKDNLLHELLATARCADSSLNGSLDQLREEMQVLLQVKRRTQEARLLLDERERKQGAFQQELKVGQLLELEGDMAAAKKKTKALNEKWAQANAGPKETEAFATAKRLHARAKELSLELAEVERQCHKDRRKSVVLQDEIARIEQTMDDDAETVAGLKEKRIHIEEKMEEAEDELRDMPPLAELEEEHEKLAAQSCSWAKSERDEGQKTLEEESDDQEGFSVDERLLAPGFHPLHGKVGREMELLLWRLRHAVSHGSASGLDILAAEATGADRVVTATGLVRALQRLRVPGAQKSAVQQLIAAFSGGCTLAGEAACEVGLSPANFVLSLPLQRPPAGPIESELQSAAEKLRWACWRKGMTERQVRNCIASWAARPRAELAMEALRLCGELGIDIKKDAGLCQTLELHGEQVLTVLSPWSCISQKAQAALLVRFVMDLARHRSDMLPRFSSSYMRLKDFLLAGSHLGEMWSRSDLEQIALVAEPARNLDLDGEGFAPVVDGQRLKRAAATPSGFTVEFPQAAKECSADLLAACEEAAKRRPVALANGSEEVAHQAPRHDTDEFGLGDVSAGHEPGASKD